MSKESHYIERIRKYTSHSDLLRLWERIRNRNPGDTTKEQGWPPGKAFEYLILRAFEMEGAAVVWPYSVKMQKKVVEQIDGVVYSAGMMTLIEAKDYSADLTVAPIAKIRNQLLRRPPFAMGVVFSSRGFTEEAKILARMTMIPTVLLWEGKEVEYALERSAMVRGLEIKLRRAVERGLPDFYLLEETNL